MPRTLTPGAKWKRSLIQAPIVPGVRSTLVPSIVARTRRRVLSTERWSGNETGAASRSQSLLEGARESGFAAEALHHFPSAEAAGEFLRTFLRQGDLVLIKGSRGVGLDKAVAILEEQR